MLAFALGTGIISYVLFILGVLGLYNMPVLFVLGLVCIIFYVSLLIKYNALAYVRRSFTFLLHGDSWLLKITFMIIGTLLFLNLIVALSPERGFDALWYHLVIPSVFLQRGELSFISGSLLYYSAMPKLIDMLYLIPLAFNLDVVTRLFSFMFGILTLIVTYRLSRIFLDKRMSYLAVLLLLSNLVFSWQMTTAYIDMARTFFETLAVLALFQWFQNKNNTFYIESALCMGLAISTKVLAFFSLIPMVILLISHFFNRKKPIISHKYVVTYVVLATLIVTPWLIFALVNTGNPFYPFFTPTYSVGFGLELLNPLFFIKEIWNIFTSSPDPVSPLYLAIVPLIFVYYNKFKSLERRLLWYSLFALVAWYIVPNTGGGRFILPYLPIFSVLFFITFHYVVNIHLRKVLYAALIIIIGVTFVSRLFIAGKAIPVVVGLESQDEFLSKNLNFAYGDFYDAGGELGKILQKDDVVLVYGIHNLHYAKFNYIHESWLKKGDIFNYILTQNAHVPDEFYFFKKVYSNQITGVSLYYGGGFWEY